MVVQHNLTAMNSNRMLGLTTKSQAKATEKLSSGYKINRAADDAAGLAISEKMRKQIRGLTQASANAQDGISAVQTAEGALTEVHDMIQRMSELATKSANGTNSQEERDYIQLEIDQLVDEIDRVAETTKFNDLYLLKGGDEEGTVTRTIPATEGKEAVTFSAAYKNAGTKTIEAVAGKTLYKAGEGTAIAADKLSEVLEIDSSGKVAIKEGVVLYSVADTAQIAGTGVEASTISDYAVVKTSGVLYSAAAADTDTAQSASVAIAESNLSQYIDSDGHITKDVYVEKGTDAVVAGKLSDYVDITTAQAAVASTAADTEEVKVAAMTLKLHVGAESSSTNKISVQILKMDAETLDVEGLKVNSEEDATAAIDKLNSSLRIVSEQRAKLGATQNRLEHTINNLDNVVENTTAAESQIRDTDMATQMVLYSNNNILAQAGQAMLAQSNQANQGVLSLLS